MLVPHHAHGLVDARAPAAVLVLLPRRRVVHTPLQPLRLGVGWVVGRGELLPDLRARPQVAIFGVDVGDGSDDPRVVDQLVLGDQPGDGDDGAVGNVLLVLAGVVRSGAAGEAICRHDETRSRKQRQ